jgi:hypothetical protein
MKSPVHCKGWTSKECSGERGVQFTAKEWASKVCSGVRLAYLGRQTKYKGVAYSCLRR